MIELSPDAFRAVTPLFDGVDHSIALVHAVIEGSSPGRVFADRVDAPSCAYLVHEGAFHYVGGNAAHRGFHQAMLSLIFDDVLCWREEQELVLFAFSDAWREKLDGLLGARSAKRIHRRMFAFSPPRFQAHAGWRERLPEGIRLRNIDEQLAERSADFRPLVDPGTKRFGVCVMVGGEIASVCSAVAVARGEAEIDIHTVQKHRRHGYAMLAACAFIEESLARGLTPNWSCWPERQASCALAKKLGFESEPDVPAHLLSEAHVIG